MLVTFFSSSIRCLFASKSSLIIVNTRKQVAAVRTHVPLDNLFSIIPTDEKVLADAFVSKEERRIRKSESERERDALELNYVLIHHSTIQTRRRSTTGKSVRK